LLFRPSPNAACVAGVVKLESPRSCSQFTLLSCCAVPGPRLLVRAAAAAFTANTMLSIV
jgi:hypothetical protein